MQNLLTDTDAASLQPSGQW